MSKKPNKKVKKEVERKESASMKGAFWFFGSGCLAEIYLLILRKCFINGTLEQVVAWDGYLAFLPYVGLVLLAAGLAAAVLFRKEKSWKRVGGAALAVLGLFVAVASWLVRNYLVSALNPLSVVVPVLMVLAILWGLYDRECAYSLTVLGVAVLVLWICRKGVGTSAWNTLALLCGVGFVVVAAAAAFLFWKAEKNKGMVGKTRLLEEDAKGLPIYGACAAALVLVLLGMFSSTVAYYAMWAACLGIFVLAVYYTVRQL